MKPDLKRYYLMQSAYWCQQLLVLLLKLEKPRKDYNELVAHHAVTLWLVGYVATFHAVQIQSSKPSMMPQLELSCQLDTHWKCSVRQHGHTRLIPRCECN